MNGTEHADESPADRYRARWVFPVAAPPVENGVVEIAEGRLAAIHGRDDPRAVDLGNAALIPLLVNAHTHLEFSDLETPLQPASPFTAWIRTLMGHRATREISPVAAVQNGLQESLAAGVGLVGEIATEGWSADVFAGAGAEAVVFRELIGLSPDRIDESLSLARSHLEEAGSDERFVRGLSPHAPYSVHPDLLEGVVDSLEGTGIPVAMHVAETLAEREYLRDGTGEFARMLQDFGVFEPSALRPGGRPLDVLRPLSRLERALVVHANHLDDEEARFLADHPQLTVVYCPRTHAFFGHDRVAPHPWRDVLDAGGRVCLGTDSRASNPDLSIWREMQFLRKRSPDVAPSTILELGTLAGARALGRERDDGALEVGRNASFAVVGPLGGSTDPHEALFAESADVKAVVVNGKMVHGSADD